MDHFDSAPELQKNTLSAKVFIEFASSFCRGFITEFE